MEYEEIGRAEMKPDVYGGDNFETHIPRWECSFKGDMELEFIRELELSAEGFVSGTRVIIQEPVCPECEMTASICNCGFDWKAWAENEYS